MKVKLSSIWGVRLKLWAEGDKLRAEGGKLWTEGDKLRAEGDKLRAEGDKLRAEGDKLRAEGGKLWAEGDKLRAEGGKLWAEGDKLRAEGDKLWAEGVISVHGNVVIRWILNNGEYDCEVEGVIYRHKKIKVTLKEAMASARRVK